MHVLYVYQLSNCLRKPDIACIFLKASEEVTVSGRISAYGL